jgi:hypothetical protein
MKKGLRWGGVSNCKMLKKSFAEIGVMVPIILMPI